MTPQALASPGRALHARAHHLSHHCPVERISGELACGLIDRAVCAEQTSAAGCEATPCCHSVRAWDVTAVSGEGRCFVDPYEEVLSTTPRVFGGCVDHPPESITAAFRLSRLYDAASGRCLVYGNLQWTELYDLPRGELCDEVLPPCE